MSEDISCYGAPHILCGEQYDLQVPPGVNEALLRAGGINPYGQPKYRCVWGWSRREWKVGEWTDWLGDERVRTVLEARFRPKYPERQRFHFEVWMSPCSPEQWSFQTRLLVGGKMIDSLGEYPSMGDYERIGPPVEIGDKFAWPTPALAERFVRNHRINLDRSQLLIATQLGTLEQEKRQAERQRFYDGLSTVDRPFHFNPYIQVPALPGKPGNENEKEN